MLFYHSFAIAATWNQQLKFDIHSLQLIGILTALRVFYIFALHGLSTIAW